MHSQSENVEVSINLYFSFHQTVLKHDYHKHLSINEM